MQRETLSAFFVVAVLIGMSGPAEAVPVSYSGYHYPDGVPTGQTATAVFDFTESGQLKIILTETTPIGNSTLVGDVAILTSVGFRLPGSAVIASGGTVTISLGSASEGFSIDCSSASGVQQCGAGANVSAEWGATIGGEGEIVTGSGLFYDFVSTLQSAVTRFSGTNRDGSTQLGGPQGGLLLDSAARGGQGVINSSVTILLNLDADPSTSGNQGLTGGQQSDFLNSVSSQSLVKWGTSTSLGNDWRLNGNQVPEPGTLLLLGSGLISAAIIGRRFSKRG